ncbi:unnamed protein product [Umbelopsis ramanniana]
MESSSKTSIQIQKGIENDLENATATLSLLLQPMMYDQDLFEQADLWTDVPDLEVPPIDSFLPELSEDDEEDYYQYIPEENECCICALLEPGVYCLTHLDHLVISNWMWFPSMYLIARILCLLIALLLMTLISPFSLILTSLNFKRYHPRSRLCTVYKNHNTAPFLFIPTPSSHPCNLSSSNLQTKRSLIF